MARREVDPRALKLEKKDDYINLFEAEAVGRELEKLEKGRPSQDYVLLNVNKGDWAEKVDHQNHKHKEFTTTVFQLKEVGPDVKNPKCRPGAWVMVSPGARMTIMEWGEKQNVIVREYEIMYYFDLNPKEEFQKELDKYRENKNRDSKPEHMPLVNGGDA